MPEPYNPCRNGIHVCGADGDGTAPVTVDNFPDASWTTFERARAELAMTCGGDPDLVVDFCRYGDIASDFPIRRQQLERLRQIVKEAA